MLSSTRARLRASRKGHDLTLTFSRPVPTPDDRDPTALLRILQTTDLHGHVLAYDYHRDTAAGDRGLSRAATMIAEARASADLCLLFDSGDFLQGSPIADRLAMADAPGLTSHPVISAMNHVGFDAVTLGNHDLDFGLEHLAQALACADFPVVSANLHLPGPLAERVKPHIILERRLPGNPSPIRIGVTGCLPAGTLPGTTGRDPDIRCDPVEPSLRKAIAQMRAAGADLIIVLAHCGLGRGDGRESAETIDETITHIDGIDAILGGHTHEVYPPTGPFPARGRAAHQTVVISGAWGAYLGQVDFHMGRMKDSAGAWHVKARHVACPRPTKDAGESPGLISRLAAHHEATLAAYGAAIGETRKAINSFFALVEDNAGLQLVADAFAQRIETARQGLALPNRPVLSMIAPYRTGQRAGAQNYCDIPPGPISLRDVDTLYSFPDTLCALDVSGADLRMILEMSASVFNCVEKGARDAPLFEPSFPGYRFDVIPQLSYQIDLSRPALYDQRKHCMRQGPGRIRALCHEGRPVKDDARFLLAANSFRARGGWPTKADGTAGAPELILDTGQTCRRILREYIASHSPLEAVARPRWCFVPLEGASVLFETAPQAQPGNPARIERVGANSDGFAIMRLDLSAPSGRGS